LNNSPERTLAQRIAPVLQKIRDSIVRSARRQAASLHDEIRDSRPVALAAMAIGGVFVLDLMLPSALVPYCLYSVPVLISFWSPRREHTLLVANCCTALVAIGVVALPPKVDRWTVISNRFFGLCVIWSVTLIGLLLRRRDGKVHEDLREMDTQLQRRTNELTIANEDMRKEIADRQRAEDSLRQLSGHLLHLQDTERRRIARELHDTTGQSLAAIALNLSRIEKLGGAKLDTKALDILAETVSIAEQCSRELRTISYLLHPPLLEEAGLVSAVRWYADGVSQRARIQISVDVAPDFRRLPPDVETTLFRILQESLTNITRHSGSPTARIRILRGSGEVVLEVKDEGKGIPPEKLQKVNGNVSGLGVGLAGIWERVRQFNGELDVNSNSQGTTITVVVPFQEESHEQIENPDRR
jgi:signal transduction histidine kinase